MIVNKDRLKPLDRNEKVLNLTSEEDLETLRKAFINVGETGIKLGESLKSVLTRVNK